jgi:hypothetical protein
MFWSPRGWVYISPIMRTIATLSLLLVMAAGSYADVMPVPIPEVPEPGSDPVNVEMKDELLRIRVAGRSAQVDVHFVMHNNGGAARHNVAFLSQGFGDLKNFQLRINGQAVEVKEKTPTRQEIGIAGRHRTSLFRWKEWPMSWKKGETKTIDISYEMSAVLRNALNLPPDATPWLSAAERIELDKAFVVGRITYVLWSGKYWQNAIGRLRAEVRVDGSRPGSIVGASPPGGVVGANVVTWDLANYEPHGNLVVDWLLHSDLASQRRIVDEQLRLHPDAAAFAYSAGRYLGERGFPAQQVEVYRAALNRWPGNIGDDEGKLVALYEIGAFLIQHYDGRGETAEARAIAPRVLALGEAELKRTLAGPVMGKFR